MYSNEPHEAQMQKVHERGRELQHRAAIRENLHPQASDIVERLVSSYPWLPPGVVASIAQVGADPSSSTVAQVARMAYQQRTRTNDWGPEPGDLLLPKAPPEPVEPYAPESQPSMPSPAPSPQSPAGTQSLVNPTPEPLPGSA